MHGILSIGKKTMGNKQKKREREGKGRTPTPEKLIFFHPFVLLYSPQYYFPPSPSFFFSSPLIPSFVSLSVILIIVLFVKKKIYHLLLPISAFIIFLLSCSSFFSLSPALSLLSSVSAIFYMMNKIQNRYIYVDNSWVFLLLNFLSLCF